MGMEQEAIIEQLQKIIRSTVPEAASLPKYGGKLFTLKPDEKEGQFCGIFAHKNHVKISFAHGFALADPKKVLLGTGRFRRHINFSNAAEIEPVVLTELLSAAADYSRSID